MLVAQCRMKNTTGCLVCLIQFFILCHFVSFWAQIEASSVAREKKNTTTFKRTGNRGDINI